MNGIAHKPILKPHRTTVPIAPTPNMSKPSMIPAARNAAKIDNAIVMIMFYTSKLVAH